MNARRSIPSRRPSRPRTEALRQSEPLPVAASRTAEVVLDVEVDGERVHLVLANCGDAVATDIVVDFSRALSGLGGSLDVSRLPVFGRLGVLRPGRTLRVFWDAAPSLFARDQAAPFVATVSWSEALRPRQRADYHHDPSIYRTLPGCL